MSQALSKVNASAEKGSFWQQFSAVLALRMTPVIPFRYPLILLASVIIVPNDRAPACRHVNHEAQQAMIRAESVWAAQLSCY